MGRGVRRSGWLARSASAPARRGPGQASSAARWAAGLGPRGTAISHLYAGVIFLSSILIAVAWERLPAPGPGAVLPTPAAGLGAAHQDTSPPPPAPPPLLVAPFPLAAGA